MHMRKNTFICLSRSGICKSRVFFFACFFKLNKIALYICTILFLSISLLIDI